jgi:hypothetical protein
MNTCRCEQTSCSFSKCKLLTCYYASSGENGLCAKHQSEYGPVCEPGPLHYIDGKSHFKDCPALFTPCECKHSSADCVGFAPRGQERNVCTPCYRKNTCSECDNYHDTGKEWCSDCIRITKCPVCAVVYEGTVETAGCPDHDSQCVTFNCCGVSTRIDHWLNAFRIYPDYACTMHKRYRNTIRITIVNMWAAKNVFGREFTPIEYNYPTGNPSAMTRIEFTSYINKLQTAKTTDEIAFAMGIIVKLPKDLLLVVLRIVESEEQSDHTCEDW